MKPRERVLAALNRREPDKVPRTLGFTPAMFEKFRRQTGSESPAEYFDFEVRHVGLQPTQLQTDFAPYLGELPPNAWVNEWGIGHVPGSLYHFEDYVHPLRQATSAQDIRAYPFPDVNADYRYQGVAEKVAAWHERGYAVAAGPPHYSGTLFECAWILVGMEKLLSDFLLNPELASELLDWLTHSAVESAARLARAGVDILTTGDDVGTQRGMMMSPALWRRWLKPRMAEIIAAAKREKGDILVFYHSDGNIEPIIPELIEIGVDILNPVQPECMDPARLKREYKDDLSFWGTIGTQTTMPFGTPDQVKETIHERIDTVGRGGGLLLAPTHVLEPEVPWENVVAFMEAIDEHRAGGRTPGG
jgi:uroporphyrinogen decarboxylase